MSEAKLEATARNYAEFHPTCGALSFRFKFLGYRGGQDCVFFPRDKSVLWVEFKNPNKRGKVHPLQIWVHNKLVAFGHTVHVVDNINQFKEIYDAHVQ